jgi:hypothetical protein
MKYQQCISSARKNKLIQDLTSDLSQPLIRAEVVLPEDHQALLLSLGQGISGLNGYFRLFGDLRNGYGSLTYWNDLETWKFAWPKHVQEFICFGETAWGDQYCYKREDVSSQDNPPVYFLDAIRMNPEVAYRNFDEFFFKDFMRNLTSPYSEMVLATRQKFFELDPKIHLIQSPSMLLCGKEDISLLIKQPAVSAMVVNGDILQQLRSEGQNSKLLRSEPHIDEKGRSRLRLVFEK